MHTKYFKDRFIAAIKSTIDPLDVLCIFKLPAENLHFKIFRYFLSIYQGIITLLYISEQNHAGCQNSWTIVQLDSKVVEIGRKHTKKYTPKIYIFSFIFKKDLLYCCYLATTLDPNSGKPTFYSVFL